MLTKLQYHIMLLRETCGLTDEQECLLLFDQCEKMAENTGAGHYRIHFRPTAEEQQELYSLYDRMIRLCDLFGWESPEQTLKRYINYGYMPLLPKGAVKWTTTQIS